MRTDDKTPSVAMGRFSLGNRSQDDKTTKADKTPSVVKARGTLGRRQADDKTSPPLRVRVLSSSSVPLTVSGELSVEGHPSFASSASPALAVATTKPGHKAKRVLSSPPSAAGIAAHSAEVAA